MKYKFTAHHMSIVPKLAMPSRMFPRQGQLL